VTPELTAFSDWTLALLPRIFLYPGGLSLLIALLLLRVASRDPSSISVRLLFADLLQANLLSVALAWAALALAPFPGSGPLPSPVDTLVLAALPALSLLLDANAPSGRHIAAVGAITLALILPAVASNSLLPPLASLSLLSIISSLAVISGLLALAWMGDMGMAGQVRWLAWLYLGIALVWQRFMGDGLWVAGLFILLRVLVLHGTSRRWRLISTEGDLETPLPNHRSVAFRATTWAIVIGWLLALLALVWALLAVS
jgi:hypothetical protein